MKLIFLNTYIIAVKEINKPSEMISISPLFVLTSPYIGGGNVGVYFKIWDSKSRIWDSEFRLRDSEFGFKSAILVSESHRQDSESHIWDLKFEIISHIPSTNVR